MPNPYRLITVALCSVSLSTFAAMSHVDKLGQRYDMPAKAQKPGTRISKSKALMPQGPRKFMLGEYTKVHVTGNVDLTIRGRVSQASVMADHSHSWVMNVPAKQDEQFRKVMWARHGTLYVNNVGVAQPLQLTLNMPELDGLVLQGHVNVQSSNLRSRGLSIYDASTGHVALNGMLDVDAVNHQGSGDLSISWVNSKTLRVRSWGAGAVRLGGVADNLRARLYGRAFLNAEFLRAQHAMVRTAQISRANIFPIKDAEAFAYDYSNIYLYHAPLSLNRITMQSGNVFQADWRL